MRSWYAYNQFNKDGIDNKYIGQLHQSVNGAFNKN